MYEGATNMTAVTEPDQVRALLAAMLVPAASCPGPGAVGLESEHFVVHVDAHGAPVGRADLSTMTAVLDEHPALDPEPPSATSLTGWRTADGARLLPEPGAQLEFAGPPAWTAAAALGSMSNAIGDIATVLDSRGLALVSAGLDVWHPAGSVRQQLACPRYPAMHDYFARRGPHGRTMMTHTASLQVNLDLGTGSQPVDRWATALLASPLTTATFACSPAAGAVNGRALAWQWLDPTRTGVPAAFVAGEDDPVRALCAQALAADVLLFHAAEDTVPGEPGFTLERWITDGHPVHGRPTTADVAYHLTTLFPEVRLRGFLEIRSVDALPERWRAVPVVLLAGLLYDDRTLDGVRALLEPQRSRLPELLQRAAHLGVADGELCAMAVEVWTMAAEGAARLGPAFLDAADIRRTERFLDRFTLRGRTPADELRERFVDGPAAALDWAREPVGTLTLC
ncbi:Glutamate--cysteine ligase [Euzebya pacifica]|uniref:glutamate--cysteine ligase n=1 Tax=Euzebya pacifica TaxID=1608957 RepID=A0A346Y265_9ACTN|nr:Glutamate--cysteine ligase [Euzebya pacifica]